MLLLLPEDEDVEDRAPSIILNLKHIPLLFRELVCFV